MIATTTKTRLNSIEDQIKFAAQRTAIQSKTLADANRRRFLYINVSSLFRYYGIFLDLEELLRLARPSFKSIDGCLREDLISLKGAAILVAIATQ